MKLLAIRSGYFIIIIFIICLSLGRVPLMAAPYAGEYFNLRQPDGSYVEVRVWGDEFYQRIESLDGYTLIKEPDREWICYASLADNGTEFVSTGIVYTCGSLSESLQNQPPGIFPDPSFDQANLSKHIELPGNVISEKADIVRNGLMKEFDISSTAPGQPDYRSRRLRRLTGSVIGLTLLINFPDVSSYISDEEIHDFLNKPGYNRYGCNGSVRDYFYDVSGGLIEYTNYVTAFYTAKHNKGYYTDPRIRIGIRAQELIGEALDHLDKVIGFDFSKLSTDSNCILGLNVFYAGYVDNAWAQGLWPHKGYYPDFEADGVRSRYYQISNIGDNLDLRTFCHENGHTLFNWPDLYDYGYESWGVGNYCLMGFGGDNDNPVPPCAYLRHEAGWENIIGISNEPSLSSFTHISNSLTTYRYSNQQNLQEMFFIESRIQEGRNIHLPSEGLMVWHVHIVGNNNHEQRNCAKHYQVSLEQADGLYDLEHRGNFGDAGDLFDDGDEFNNNTEPSSDWWCDDQSILAIGNIHIINNEVNFTVGSDLELRGQRISSGVYPANSIMAGPDITIERGSQVTFIARESISAFKNFTIEEDAQVVFKAQLIRANHNFIIKGGGKLSLKASDSIIIGPDFTVENGATVDLEAKNLIQFWPALRVQEKV